MVSAPAFMLRTKAEQIVEHLEAEGRRRPLTPKESIQLSRSLHAVYERQRRRA